jgi:hypothetical protein
MIKRVEGSIRLIKVPEGEHPFEIRKGWLGPILPVSFVSDEGHFQSRSGRKAPKAWRYDLDQSLALEALGKESPETAEYLRAQGFPRPGECFSFKFSEAVVIGELTEVAEKVTMYLGLLEVGVGAHDANP